jgi:hypothetical protein
MTMPANDWTPQGHAADHGVRAFDGELGTARPVAHGRLEVRRTMQGRYYALFELDSALGHLCAAVHLEGGSGRGLVSAGAEPATPALDLLADRLDEAASRLSVAAAESNVDPQVLRAALLVVRAHAGDDRARDFLRRIRAAAKLGSEGARRRLRLLYQGREFARSVLEVADPRTETGNLFGDIGNSLHTAVKTVSHVAHDVAKAEKSVEHAIGPAMRSIKQWGPMILSDVQGGVSLIPGIGTGISAAIGAAEATLSGGLNHPIEFAVRMAYGAIPIPPGIRPICDTVLDAVLHFIENPHNFGDAVIATVRDRIPKGLPQEVFDTLVKVIFKHQPIGRAAGELAIHCVTQYTQGAAAALAHSLPKLPPELQAKLAHLPDPKLAFESIHKIAPHFTVDPSLAGELVQHAAASMGRTLPPELHAATTAAVAAAAQAHAISAAQMRLAQHAFEAPRAQGTAPPASLAVEVSPDGRQQRIVGSEALSHLVTAVAT